MKRPENKSPIIKGMIAIVQMNLLIYPICCTQPLSETFQYRGQPSLTWKALRSSVKVWEGKQEVELTAGTVNLLSPFQPKRHEETTTVLHQFCTVAFPCLKFLVLGCAPAHVIQTWVLKNKTSSCQQTSQGFFVPVGEGKGQLSASRDAVVKSNYQQCH